MSTGRKNHGMPWVYILECADGSFYTGSTALEHVEGRVWQHNSDDRAAANYTRSRRPVSLAFAQHFDRVDEAFAREKQIQRWSHTKKRALIDSDWERLVEAATGRTNPRASRQAR